jgi:mannose/fructose/N-acetylgalactosamine-specific phosphotransferase system component IID
MAKQMIKPYSLLLYLLAFLFFFFIGLSYAGLIEAGKGQMLAGGAIVLGYGVMGAFIGFCISLAVAYKADRKWIIRLNAIMAVGLVAFWAFYAIRFQQRKEEREQQNNEIKMEAPRKLSPTAPAENNTL